MEEKGLFSISIKQLLQRKIGKGLGNDIIATSQLKEHISLFTFPLRVDAMVFLVCAKGNIKLTINLTEWDVKQNDYVISLPENIIGVSSISDDFDGYIILFSMDYLRKISIDIKDALPYYMYVRNKPCFNVAPLNAKKISQFYDLLSSSLEDDRSNRKEDIVKGLVIAIISQISEDLDEFGLKTIAVKTKSKEYYFMKFMDLLLHHFREQHNVSFYSDNLALTPKYFSSLMKEISGLSASQWINEYIVVEAKTLLKFSDMNIMQIADYLFFPNQSFFSKYFKQHTGITPKQYRNE